MIGVSDPDEDDVINKFTTRFKVYAAGTDNRLFNTPRKNFIPPASPCTTPIYTESDWYLEFFGEDNTHTGLAITFEVECSEEGLGYQSRFGSYLYVADTTQSGSGWSKSWPNELVSAEILDWDDDQQDEVKVVFVVESDASADLKIMFFDKVTGSKESSQKYTAVKLID